MDKDVNKITKMETEVGSESAPMPLPDMTLEQLQAMTRQQLIELTNSHGIFVSPAPKVWWGKCWSGTRSDPSQLTGFAAMLQGFAIVKKQTVVFEINR